MTEAQWLACEDPSPMLEFLGDKPVQYVYFRNPEPTLSDALSRRLRFFACACLRTIWHLLTAPHGRWAVEVAEQFADRQSSSLKLFRAALATAFSRPRSPNTLPGYPTSLVGFTRAIPLGHADACAGGAAKALSEVTPGTTFPGERAIQAALVRDIFGNPFRPIALDPALRTPTVVSLAQAAYDERILPSGELDPVHLSVLADALEEAGCDSADILSHLRSAGPHVRGCWALDLILGKQ